jgi:flavin reductase (DIM6/NTAB) family NADH-FMN oxidoreductase RutF
VKQWLQSFLFPQYATLPLTDPQTQIDVYLRGQEAPVNVTRNNVVTALLPLTLGIMSPRLAPLRGTQLTFEERSTRRLLGTIDLRPAGAVELPEHRFDLYETPSSNNRCLPWLNMRLNDLYQLWRTNKLQRANPYNFRMTNSDMRAIFTFYICPRPVVLVSVEHEGASNLFPMDLVGPTDSPWFSMALRKTSPAVRLMQASRRMAIASLPFEWKDQIYELGKHHKLEAIDWSALPFPIVRSPEFGLRIPDPAFRVREVAVHEIREVGSHVLFLTTIESDSLAGDSQAQLFHMAGSYDRYLRRR